MECNWYFEHPLFKGFETPKLDAAGVSLKVVIRVRKFFAVWAQYDVLTLKWCDLQTVLWRWWKRWILPITRTKSHSKTINKTCARKVGWSFEVKKSQSQLKVRFYWYGWKRHAEIVCRCCKACNEYFRGAMPRHGFLQDMRVGAPMERLQIDLTGSHPRSSKDGFVYIFTCMCAFT